MTTSEFQSKVANANALDFGTIFNQSIELFKKSWIQGFLMQLFLMLLFLPFFLMLYLPVIFTIISQSEAGEYNPNSLDAVFSGFSMFYMLLFLVGVLVIAVIQMALNAAFFRILRSLDEGHEVKTSDLFYFLKSKYFGKMALLIFVIILIAIPAALFFYLPLIYVSIPLSFISIIFAFNPEWSIGDIVGSAFRLGNKKWLLAFGLFVLSYLAIMILTLMTCGLGSLFLASFMYHPIYCVYKEVIGFEYSSELDRIGETEIF